MKAIFTLAYFLLLTTFCLAQAPQAFNYSAVVRNGSGNPIPNQLVKFRLSILRGSVTGTSVYAETHSTTTDGNGMVNLEIGRGTIISGAFSSIPWGNDTYYLQVEVDPTGGNTFQLMGTSQFMSVPYALYAKYAESTVPSTSTLDTIQPASYYDNNFYEVTKLNINTYVGGYYLEHLTADNYGNIISNLSSSVLSHNYSGTINFTKNPPYTVQGIKLDKLGNIYATGSIESLYDTLIKFDSVNYQYINQCNIGIKYIAKYNKNGIVQWAKTINLNGCMANNDPYKYCLMDVDSAGNIYAYYHKWIKKFNTNGDSIGMVTLADSSYGYFNVNDKGEYILTKSVGGILTILAYNSNNTLKWSKQTTGLDFIFSFYYDNDEKLYMSTCFENCFSIGTSQYCERADTKRSFKLLALNNSGNLDSYVRYKNTPSVEHCLYNTNLFKVNGKLSTIASISSNFYNRGTMYTPWIILN